MVKYPPAKQDMCGQSLSWDDFLEKEWQPTLIFLPGKSHGEMSLAGYSPWGGKCVRHNFATQNITDFSCNNICHL